MVRLALRAAGRAIAGNALDATAIAGAAAIIHGVNLVSGPASWIIGGGFALVGAWLAARKGG